MEQVFIQIRFTVQTEVGEFKDAIYYTQDQYTNFNQANHDAEIQRRVDKWVNLVRNPSHIAETTKEQLEEAKAILVEQVNQLDILIESI